MTNASSCEFHASINQGASLSPLFLFPPFPGFFAITIGNRDHGVHVLALAQLGEERRPVGLDRHIGGFEDLADVFSRDLEALVVEDKRSVHARKLGAHGLWGRWVSVFACEGRGPEDRRGRANGVNIVTEVSSDPAARRRPG